MTVHHEITGCENEAATTALLADLAAENYAGPNTARFRNDLWLSGWYQLRGLLRTGKIAFTAKPRHRTPLEIEDLEVFHSVKETREEIVLDILERCVDPFIARLRENKGWKPGHGASLNTYFIGFCTNSFHANLYARWQTRQRALRWQQAELDEATQRPPTKNHPQDDITDQITQHKAIMLILKHGATGEQRAISNCLLRGMTHSEIAEYLQIPKTRIARQLSALRQYAKTEVIRGNIDRAVIPGRRWVQ